MIKVECEREDCRIQALGCTTTCMGYLPTYDKNGNLISKDPNTRTCRYSCSICNREWTTKTQYGILQLKEIK